MRIPREEAVRRAAEILEQEKVVDDVITAYRVLVEKQRELGYPVTYDLVVDAMRRLAVKLKEREKPKRVGLAKAYATITSGYPPGKSNFKTL